MSTKIYDGCYINTTSLKEINKFLNKLKNQLGQKREELIYNKIISLFTNTYDKLTLAKNEEDKNKIIDFLFKDKKIDITDTLMFKIDEYVCKEYFDIYKTMNRNPSFDFGFSISLIPFKNKTLIIPYYDNIELRDIFFSFEEIIDYSYWNNTDKPDKITNREWNKRKNNWDEALGSNTVSSVSLNFEPFNNNMWYFLKYNDDSYNKLLNIIPSFEDRVSKISKNNIINKKCKELKDLQKNEDGLGYYYDTMDYIQTEEGLKDIENEKNIIRNNIKKDLDINDLKIKIKDLF